MSTLHRYLEAQIVSDLKEKMVFLGGPRQVGKTTFSQSLLRSPKLIESSYYNWDDFEDRKKIQERVWSKDQKLIVLDEIHKFPKWRSLIKGIFDKQKNEHQFLVTGSARLDYYRKSGDSLLGRYYYYRLHPLSPTELKDHTSLQTLLQFGGFPEPFLKQNLRFLKRWHLGRRERIIYSDIRELEKVREVAMIGQLCEALAPRVGSPLSRKNLAQDLEVDFKTAERWLQILENVYYCFRISAYGTTGFRSVKKEQKVYLWDWSEHSDEGKRWENFVASQLLKYCHFHQDIFGDKMELKFLRDDFGREVDFVVLKNSEAIFAVEAKVSESRSISPHLKYFSERVKIPKFYQVHSGKNSFVIDQKTKSLSFADFAKETILI